MTRYAAPLWAFGQVAVQIFRDVPSLLLLFYMTQLLEVPPAMAGIAIFGPKLFWAVICDYAVGFLSDRWRAKVPRRTFLLIGAALAPVAMLLLFGGTSAETAEGRAVYIALVLAFYMLVFAIFSVPHLAIGMELGPTPEARAGVMGWRIAFAGVGLLIGASVAPILVERLGADADAYRTVAAAMAAACSIALIISWFGAREAKPDAGAKRPTGSWRAIISDRPLVILFAVLALQLTASGMSYASLAYLFTFNLAYAEPLTVLGIFVLITSILAIIAQPLWVTLARSLGKRIGLLIASLGFGLTLFSVLILPARETMPVYWVAVGMGLFNSGCYLNIYAMLTDIVERNTREEGISRAGLYSGVFTAGDKIAFAIGGTLLTGSVLGATGFAPGSALQSPEAEAGILFAFSILPGSLFMLTCGIIFLMMREPASASPQPA